jgi:hypothetical protein
MNPSVLLTSISIDFVLKMLWQSPVPRATSEPMQMFLLVMDHSMLLLLRMKGIKIIN